MRRRSTLSAILHERLARRERAGGRMSPQRALEGLAGRDVARRVQALDAIGTRGRQHGNTFAVMGDLDRLAGADTTDRRSQVVAKLSYAHLLRHCDHMMPHSSMAARKHPLGPLQRSASAASIRRSRPRARWATLRYFSGDQQ